MGVFIYIYTMKSTPISTSGYKKNSPDRNESSLIIPSGDITMENVLHHVLGIDNLGNAMLMSPGKNYKFKGNSVFEIPLKQFGGDSYDMSIALRNRKKGGNKNSNMKKPNNPGFNSLPKKVQEMIIDHMNRGGEMPYMAMGGGFGSAFGDQPGADLFGIGTVMNYAQMGKNLTAQQWHDQNTAAGNLPANWRVGSGDFNINDQIKVGQYPTYYNPKTHTPNETGGFADPNALISYQRPVATNVSGSSSTSSSGFQTPGAGKPPSVSSWFAPKSNPQITPKWVPMGQGITGAQSFKRGDINEGDKRYQFENGAYVPHDFTQDSTGVGSQGPTMMTKQFGGDMMNHLKNFLGEYVKKQYGGNSKSTAPQGDTTDSFIQNQKGDFMNYLKGNVMKHMMMEELGNQMKQYGGPMYAQDGKNVINPSITPGSDWGNFTSGPFGAYSNNPAGNTNSPQNNNDPWHTASNVADGLMSGLNIFSNLSESALNKQKAQMAKDKMSAENIFKSAQGNRGDYDINSGNFRPNQYTPKQYKKGGSYKLDAKEIKRLQDMGYELDIID